MGSKSRNKGKAGELEFANILTDHLGIKIKRNLSQFQDGGHDLDNLPFALEIKRCEQLALEKWWAQACDQAERANLLPALAYRQSRQPWRIIVPYLFAPEIGAAWKNDLAYTCTLYVEGFCALVREHLVK